VAHISKQEKLYKIKEDHYAMIKESLQQETSY
jgi:hypothetical protein